MADWSVRAARPPADNAAIEEVMIEAALVAYVEIFPNATRSDYARGRATWLSEPPPSPAYTFVVEDHDIIVGTISAFELGPARARVEGFYVKPTYQGRGVGRALWDRIVLVLQDSGYGDVDLYVLAANEAARKVYEKLGCRLDGSATGTMTVGSRIVDGVRYQVPM